MGRTWHQSSVVVLNVGLEAIFEHGDIFERVEEFGDIVEISVETAYKHERYDDNRDQNHNHSQVLEGS